MSGLDTAPSPAGSAAGGTPGCETCLGPDGAFPGELSALSLVELQVLHSRVACQLEHEYLTGPDGPHPVTQDRHDELVAELEARGGSAPAG